MVKDRVPVRNDGNISLDECENEEKKSNTNIKSRPVRYPPPAYCIPVGTIFFQTLVNKCEIFGVMETHTGSN